MLNRSNTACTALNKHFSVDKLFHTASHSVVVSPKTSFIYQLPLVGSGCLMVRAPAYQSNDSDDHINVGHVSFNCGYKRTIEDDMHPGSDHPQCQHIKVGLAIMFRKRLTS